MQKVLLLIAVAAACFGAGALICMLIFRGRNSSSKTVIWRRVILAYLLGVLFLVITGAVWLMTYKRPGDDALRALQSNDTVSVEKTEYGYFMDGPGEEAAFVFYPGTKIAVECYAPLMKDVADKGIDVFMVDMPFNIAALNRNAAEEIIEWNSYNSWYIGGHSLGGVAASQYAGENPDMLDGVILMASYPGCEIPDQLRLLSVRASLDTVLDGKAYEESRTNWPSESVEYTIDGGNHTGFADCSLIKWDSEAAILPDVQQRLCSEAIVSFVSPQIPEETLPPEENAEENGYADPVPPQEESTEPELPEENRGEKPALLADRLNDNSSLWDSGREYSFPEGEKEIYTSMGTYCNMRVLSLASQEHSDTVVIYIHGGAYLSDFDNGYYYPVTKRITLETGYEVLVPQYPLLTGFNFTHAYICLQSLYYRVVAEYGSDNVIVMGDSAGGALAAGLCMQAAENSWEQPAQLVLVSPWVDLMITHPETDRYQELDKNLDAYMLRLYGELWAAGENPSDYHLSPLYGDVTVFRDVTLYYGDSELFTPTEQLFYEKLSGKGVSCEQVIGEGLGHDCAITDEAMLKDLCDRMVAKQNALVDNAAQETG